MKTRYTGLIALAVILTAPAFAPTAGAVPAAEQQAAGDITVSGTVTDPSGDPVIGAPIAAGGKTLVITDFDGRFQVKVPSGTQISVSYMGYKPATVTATQSGPVTIVLTEDTQRLQEVVVVGYGVQKKASVTGSVAAINADKLVEVKAPNVTNMLAGRLPGLRAVQRSGSPGDDGASVDIRGYGSMLVIVDGVERDYTQLDPNDIESISILKDASAAVYGFKGANGVLLVTTKRGKAEKAKVTYNGYVGFQHATRYPKMMNAYEYANMYNEAIFNNNPWTAAPAYSEEQLARFKSGEQGTDWWNSTMRGDAPQTSHNLSITGGNEKAQYYISAGYLYQGGLLKSGDWNYNRYNVRSNVTVNVTNDFKVDVQLSGRLDQRKKPYNADNIFRAAQMAIPTYSIYANDNPDYWGSVGDMTNPVHNSYIDNAGYDNRDRREFNSVISLEWKLPWIKGLSLKGMLAYDYKNTEWKTWRKELTEYTYNGETDSYVGKTVNTANLNNKQTNYSKPTLQLSATYSNKFAEKHQLDLTAVWEMYNDKTTWIEGSKDSALGLLDDLHYGDATNQSVDGNTAKTSHAGLVGKINYSYDNIYLLELDCRYDGTYKFRPGSRWGFFPGVSVGWRPSQYDVMRKIIPGIDDLKIRASYAKVGDEGDFDAFQYLEGYESGGSYIMGSDGVTSGLTTTGMANYWLTWYESKIFNAGLDFSWHNRLIAFSFDWFRRRRTGLPATRIGSLPTTFGETMPQENLNSDTNTGFEFEISHRNTIGKFSYSISANVSLVNIKYDHVEMAVPGNSYLNWRNNTNNRYQGIQWGKKVIGQFQSYEEILTSPVQDEAGNTTLLPGDLKFEDVNHDGLINDLDTQPLGRGNTPRIYYGLNFSAIYSGFDLSFFLQGAGGHDLYVSGDIMDPFIQQGLGNGLQLMTDRWHRADPTDPYSEWIPGYMPPVRVQGMAANRSGSSFTLHDATYLRLKSIELGYTLPKNIARFISASSVRFYVNGYNLLTFTNRNGIMKNVDPETNSTGLRYYPQMKAYNFGVNITF